MFSSRLILPALLITLHTYLGVRLIPDLHLSIAGIVIAVLLLIASALLMPLGMTHRLIRDALWSDRAAWVGMSVMGVFSSLFVFTVLRDVGLLFAWLALSPARFAAVAHATAVAVVIGAIVASVLGAFNARRRAQVVEVKVPIDNLPAALAGFSIVQISDVHVGPTIKRGYVASIVAAVNQLEPDVIAITGDLVDGSVQRLATHVEPLAELQARCGSYFVTGNHEYYSGATPWLRELQRLGLRVLLNEHVVIERENARVVLAGVTDYTAHRFQDGHRSDPEMAIRGAPQEAAVRILLAHQPRTSSAAAAAGFDLQLSGHTHGGQFWPWNHFVRYQQPYTAGLHRLGRLWIYISRGTGYWGPPKRIGAPSEITRIRLVAA